jgi:hypothetical protein
LLKNLLSGQIGYLDEFEVNAYFQRETARTLNTKVLENVITFLTMGRTQGFNSEWSGDWLKPVNFQDMIVLV